MKHERLLHSIAGAAADEIKFLLAPLIASELARQRAGGDPNAPPGLPQLIRSADRIRICTRVAWSAATQLNLISEVTRCGVETLTTRIERLVHDSLVAEKVADGTAQREYDALVAEVEGSRRMREAAEARIAHVKDIPRCEAEAGARESLRSLIATLRAKRERAERAA